MGILKQIVLEIQNDHELQSSVEHFQNSIKNKYGNVIKEFLIYYNKSKKSIELTDLYIKPEFYGKGYGKLIMNELSEFADSVKLPIILIPESERGSNKKLINFYKKFGFNINTGRNKKYELSMPFSTSMYRLPTGV
jgi:GNAT superfamily N-acetyltransferase